jgi:hypothetical protein
MTDTLVSTYVWLSMLRQPPYQLPIALLCYKDPGSCCVGRLHRAVVLLFIWLSCARPLPNLIRTHLYVR